MGRRALTVKGARPPALISAESGQGTTPTLYAGTNEAKTKQTAVHGNLSVALPGELCQNTPNQARYTKRFSYGGGAVAQASLDLVVSHWYRLVEGLQVSSQDFYSSVEVALQKRQVPDVNLSRVQFAQGGMFSARREYLRVIRGQHTFDVCAAPFGSGFFISWWLSNPPGCLAGCLGVLTAFPIVAMFSHEPTYYEMDTMLMFQQSVHNAVLEVTDGLMQVQGIRALSELERKPIMRELYGRR